MVDLVIPRNRFVTRIGQISKKEEHGRRPVLNELNKSIFLKNSVTNRLLAATKFYVVMSVDGVPIFANTLGDCSVFAKQVEQVQNAH